MMGLWTIKTLPSGKKYTEVDVRQLTLRLKTIAKQGNLEVIQLALQSMLEELDEQGAR